MERRSALEAAVVQERCPCLSQDGSAYRLLGEICTRQDQCRGQQHLFYHQPRPSLPQNCNLAAQLELRDGDELVSVNGLPVSHWDHSILLRCLTHLPLTEEQELAIVVRRVVKIGGGDPRYELVQLCLQFDILEERGLGDHGAKVINVILKITERIIPVDIINIEFKKKQKVVVQQSAIGTHFMRVDKDGRSVTMAQINTQERQAYGFIQYLFCGLDNRKNDEVVFMCALQSEATKGFLSAQLHTNEIDLSPAEDMDTEIHSLTKPDPRLFQIVQTLTTSRFIFRSVLYDDYYLYFDIVSGLRLKRSDPGPQDPHCMRSDLCNFMFDIFKAPRT